MRSFTNCLIRIVFTFFALSISFVSHSQNCANIRASGLLYCADNTTLTLRAESDKSTCISNKVAWFASSAAGPLVALGKGCDFITPKLKGNVKYYVSDLNDPTQVEESNIGFNTNNPALTNPNPVVYYGGQYRTQFVPTQDVLLKSAEVRIVKCPDVITDSIEFELTDYSLVPPLTIKKRAKYSCNVGNNISLEMNLTLLEGHSYDLAFTANGGGFIPYGFSGTPGVTLDYNAAFKNLISVTSSGDQAGRTAGTDGFGPFFNWVVDAETNLAGCPKLPVNLVQRCSEICGDGIDNDSDGETDEACLPFPCKGKLYQSIKNQVYKMSIDPLVFTSILPIPIPDVTINALGYNPQDNLLYAFLRTSANLDDIGKLVRISVDGSYEYLDNIVTRDGKKVGNGFAATIGYDGYYYFIERATNLLYVIEIASASEIRRIQLPPNSATLGDIAYNPTNGFLYGIKEQPPLRMVEINPKNGNVKLFPNLNLKDAKGNQLTTFNFTGTSTPIGAIYFQPNGQVISYGGYLDTREQNDLILIESDLVNARLVSKNNPGGTSDNDAASCPYAITMEKTVNKANVMPGDTFTYSIKFINSTGFDLQNAIFEDIIASNMKVEAILRNDLGASFLVPNTGVGKQSIKIDKAPIPKGISILKFQVKVDSIPLCKPENLANQATLSNLSAALGLSIVSDDPTTFTEDDSTKNTLDSNFKPKPFKFANISSPVCIGDTVKLTVDAGVKVTWKGPNNYRSNQNKDTLYPATQSMAGVYKVYVESLNCPSDTAKLSLVILSKPVAEIVSIGKVCSDSTIQLEAGANVALSSYSWYGDTMGLSNKEIFNPIVDSIKVTRTFSLAVVATTGCKDSTSLQVEVEKGPLLTIKDGTKCNNEVKQISASGALKYTWLANTDLTVLDPFAGTANVTNNQDKMFYVIGQNAVGCKTLDSLFMKVILVKPPLISSNSPICAGTDLLLKTSGNRSGVKWYSLSGFSSSEANPIIPNATISETGEYGAYVDSLGCKSDTSKLKAKVNAKPILKMPNDTTICKNAQINIVVTSDSTIANTNWYKNGNLLTNATNANTTTKNLVSTMFEVEIKDLNNCLDSGKIKVDISVPEDFTVTPDATICKGESKIINVDAPNATFTWKSNPTLSFISNKSYLAKPTADTTYYEIVATNNFKCDTAKTVRIVVLDNPKPSVSIKKDRDVCQGEAVVFTSSANNQGNSPTYNWYRVNSPGDTVLLGSGEKFTYPNYPNNAVVVLKLTSNIQCLTGNKNAISNSVMANVYPYPDLKVYNKINFCKTEEAKLEVLDTKGLVSNFQWQDIDNNALLPTTGSNLSLGFLSGDRNLLVSAVNQFCKDSLLVQVKLVPIAVDLSTNYSAILQGDNIELTVATTGDSLVGSATKDPTFVWGINQQKGTQKPIESGYYSVEAWKGTCVAYDTVYVKVIQPFKAPYFFSPNGDDDNDEWIVNELDNYDKSRVNIYNRWGSEVFTLGNKENVWNGKYKNGNLVPEGVYYYVIEAEIGERKVNLTGYTTIVR
jgi:gliding motility-associated-like protein/uncharacterized repeat protein (TIGR01451 family)